MAVDRLRFFKDDDEDPREGPDSDELQPLEQIHINDLLRLAVEGGASDLHLSVDLPPMIRVDGRLIRTQFLPLRAGDIHRLIYDVLTAEQIQTFERTRELDFCYSLAGVARFRSNVYRQRGSVGAAMRAIPTEIPTLEDLRLPSMLRDLSRKHSGFILVTGPTGCGKSTTLASMIDIINAERECHIMTIEDPVEYLYHHRRSMVNQRELGADTDSFQNALRAVLREDPDVILVGEMRDLETISMAITLAETGHLVFGTLHTRSAAQTVDRIVDVFPPYQQDQIKVQLSNTLEAIVSQQLVPKINHGRVVSAEIMIATPAVRNLVREGKSHQIYAAIETGADVGMVTMDKALAQLCRSGLVSYQEGSNRALDRENFDRLLRGSLP